MKLSPELPARQLLDKPLRSVLSGESRANPGDVAGEASRTVPVQDLVRSLGLPGDGLSASLLSLAKFFSLPLDSKLILQLRQQALSQGPAKTSPEQGPEDSSPAEPLRFAALAAAAAESKRVVLSPEALARYAASLAIPGKDPPEDEDGEEAGTDRNPGEAPGFAEPRERGDFAERIEGRHPLLGVLNRIPGREGRRWISLPFTFEQEGVLCRVSLRILVADSNGLPWKAERVALDIRTAQRRWSFMLENAGEGGFARALYGVLPPLPPRQERSLRELLGGFAERILPRDLSQGALPEEEAGQWGG
jgi:hypothetical protein